MYGQKQSSFHLKDKAKSLVLEVTDIRSATKEYNTVLSAVHENLVTVENSIIHPGGVERHGHITTKLNTSALCDSNEDSCLCGFDSCVSRRCV